jgi:glutathione S-transferase
MTYDLAIGDRAYSSWSLRGWLLFDAFGIPVKTHSARLYTDELPKLLEGYYPGKTAPTMRTPDGVVVPETIAIAEELASRHPDAGLWPSAPKARAIARAVAAEMHAGFSALRNHCPMNLRVSYTNCTPPDAVLTDLQRLETIWAWAQDQTTSSPWLCGAYSAADVFFAPVASRIATYNLPLNARATAYVTAAGAPWARSTARIRISIAATTPVATGRVQSPWRRTLSLAPSPKTLRAPTRANQCPMCWS